MIAHSGATLPAVTKLLARTSPAFKRVGRRARQMPRYTCSVVFELNRTIDGSLRHRLHDRSAETPPIRRSHRRAVALSPVHLEETVGIPSDVDVASIRTERAVFAGIGRKLVESHADGLGGRAVQTQLRAVQADSITDKVRKMGELGTHEVVHVDSPPTRPDQKVLIGGDRLNAIGESVDELFRVRASGLSGNGLDKTEEVLAAMIHLTQQEANLLLGMLALGNVLYHSNKMIDRPVVPTHGGAGDVDPDRRAVLTHVAFFHFVAVDLPTSKALVLCKAGLEIVRMSDVLLRLGDEFIGRITNDAGESPVDPEPFFDIGAEVGDADPGIFERCPVLPCTVCDIRAGDKHGHDAACFVLDRYKSDISDAHRAVRKNVAKFS